MSTLHDGSPSDGGSSTTDTYYPSRTPIQNFSIDYSTVNQSFHALKSAWAHLQRPPPEQVKALLNWARVNRDGTVALLGQKFADLWYSKLDIGNEHEWFFSQALGRGGFGAVALFEKQNTQTGRVEDEVVVKTTEAKRNLAASPDRLELAAEAALMGQTNEINDDGMLRLRNYKFYSIQNQWRLYFEYCPYGDLERLRVRYKAYGRYLPELFLWHTFYWLANTCKNYKSDIWRSTSSDKWGQKIDGGFLIHCDIKTQNILLGPPDADAAGDVDMYPVPRVADLGLAELLKPNNVRGSAAFHCNGTPHWMAPELRYDEVDVTNDFYPFDHVMFLAPDKSNRHRKGYHPVTSKVNIWAIGAVMYSLMTLKESDSLWRRVRNILKERHPVPRGPDESVISDNDFDILDPQYYSQDLRDLVKSCLQFQARHRPNEDQLLLHVRDGYERNLQTLRNMGYTDDPSDDEAAAALTAPTVSDAINTHPDYALYFVANEIDTAPDNYAFDHPGLTDFWWTYTFVNDLMWLPPHWGRLWPDTMPLDVGVPWDWPAGFKADFERTRGDLINEVARDQDDDPEFAERVIDPDEIVRVRQVPDDPAMALAPPPPRYPGGWVAVNAPPPAAATDAPAAAGGPEGGVGGGDGGVQQAQQVVPDVAMTGVDSSSSWGDAPGVVRGGGPIRPHRNLGRYHPYFIPRRGGRR